MFALVRWAVSGVALTCMSGWLFANSNQDSLCGAIAKNTNIDRCPRVCLTDFVHAGIAAAHFLSVDVGDDIAV